MSNQQIQIREEPVIQTYVPSKVSQLENDMDYQTGAEVESAVEAEATLREGADSNLQQQIDAIAASSDVADVVGTKAELNSYDTSKLTDNAIIKVLADESQSGATTYYRWNKTSGAFTLIGSEGPYYTKSQTDTDFQKKLVAGANIAIASDGKTISATDTTYPTFTGTDGVTDGTVGLVPKPLHSIIGPETTYLSASGTWSRVRGQGIVSGIAPKNDEDTPYGWIEGVADLGFTDAAGMEIILWYSGTTLFASQPTSYGFLRMIKRTASGQQVTQEWTALPSGKRWTRSGDSNGWSSNWVEINTGITEMSGATTSVAGTAGLAPAPTAGSPERSLKADGSWGLPRTTLGLENLDVSDDTPGGWHTAILNALSIPDTTSVYEVNIRYYSDSHFASQPATLGNLQVFLIGHTPVLQVWTTLYTGETYQRVGGPNGWDAPAWSRIIREKDAGVVSTSMLADSAITTAKINSEAVTRAKFGSGAEMVGATSSANGERGVAPAPSAGEEGGFLRGDGTWASPPLATNASAGTIQSPANKIVSITATDFNALTTKDPNTLYLVTGA